MATEYEKIAVYIIFCQQLNGANLSRRLSVKAICEYNDKLIKEMILW